MTKEDAVAELTAPRRLRFEPTVTMGNVLSIIAMAGAVMTVYVNLQIQLATQDSRIGQIESQLDDLKRIGEFVAQIRIDIATIRALYQSQLSGGNDDTLAPGARRP